MSYVKISTMEQCSKEAIPGVNRSKLHLLHLRLKRVLGLMLLAVSLPNISSADRLTERLIKPTQRLVKNAVADASSLLVDFQVYPPVLTPFSTGYGLTNGSAEDPGAAVLNPNASCVTQQTLMVYSFANSYGMPFVGPYSPPANCDFNRATFNLTVTSAGKQFDRLGLVYFGDTEIWRTSTAEPTATGIIWTYIKDMSHLLTLLKQPQTLIFDLGNLIDNTYTAPFNATLTATFFTSDDTVVPADLILPISGNNGSMGMASAFQVPPQNATKSLTLPRNINKAVFSISATGQIDEVRVYSLFVSSSNKLCKLVSMKFQC